MATKYKEGTKGKAVIKDSQSPMEKLECPICYQTCVHPVRLPCNHVFCFLCAKGVVTRNRRCAMCRQPVDPSILEDPEVLDDSHLQIEAKQQDEILWFYQARSRGWWLYETRTAKELEERYQEDDEAVFDMLIAGFIYTIDFKNMQQYRKEDRNIRRSIKRDLIKHVEVKGNAGLRVNYESTDDRPSAEGEGEAVPSQKPPIKPASKSTVLTQLVANLSLDTREDLSGESDDQESLV